MKRMGPTAEEIRKAQREAEMRDEPHPFENIWERGRTTGEIIKHAIFMREYHGDISRERVNACWHIIAVGGWCREEAPQGAIMRQPGLGWLLYDDSEGRRWWVREEATIREIHAAIGNGHDCVFPELDWRGREIPNADLIRDEASEAILTHELAGRP